MTSAGIGEVEYAVALLGFAKLAECQAVTAATSEVAIAEQSATEAAAVVAAVAEAA